MYEIIKDGTLLALTDRPAFNRLQPNGCYGSASYETARGIVVDGTVYSILGREPLPGTETVVVRVVDGGAMVLDNSEQLRQADETAIALYEAQAAQEEINAAQDEALCSLYEMIGGM